VTNEINIEIVDVVVENMGKYKKMTCTHKVVDYQGKLKIDAKAIMDFVTPVEVWETLTEAQKGDQFTISREKDKKEGKYWNWTGIARQDEPIKGEAMPAQPAGKVSFADADAKRQKYIIRQSSLGHAVALEGAGGDVDEVIDIAKKFEEFVLGE
jgi:hypothetical protein